MGNGGLDFRGHVKMLALGGVDLDQFRAKARALTASSNGSLKVLELETKFTRPSLKPTPNHELPGQRTRPDQDTILTLAVRLCTSTGFCAH